ncbi:NAD(P)-binding protein [Nemania sp. FL0916]|nr:NAD(P)-binding protein [Nemania sp. FL0916]
MPDEPPFPSPTKRWHTTAQPCGSPSRPEVSAKGKSVLVTGGGNTGIGGETARYFAAAGASRIALLGRREKPLAENKAFIESNYPGVEITTISADITKQSDVESVFSAFAQGGKIDVLIHSAAVIGPKEEVTVANSRAYLDAIQLNIAGAFWVSRSFVQHAAPNAVTIAINSWGAHLSLSDDFSSYCVAKMAVYRLWDAVAIANPNLSIFHTQSGVIVTEMNLSTGGTKSFENIKTDHVSLLASFNLWLASPEARFLKGKFLWCNWDIGELKAQAHELETGSALSIGLVGWPWGER